MIPKLTHNKPVVFHPRAEATGPTWLIPMLFSCYTVIPHASVSHLVSILWPFRPILFLFCPYHWIQYFKVLLYLIPPSIGHLRSRSPLLLQTELKYWMSCDILGYSVFEAKERNLHLLQACRNHPIHQHLIPPYTLCIALRLHTRQPTGYPVMETPPWIVQPGGHHLCLWDE